MLNAKKPYEAYARKHNVTIKHYHADNGRFADNKFIQDVTSSQQTVSYCASNARHQNGRAEKAIRDATDKSLAFNTQVAISFINTSMVICSTSRRSYQKPSVR